MQNILQYEEFETFASANKKNIVIMSHFQAVDKKKFQNVGAIAWKIPDGETRSKSSKLLLCKHRIFFKKY